MNFELKNITIIGEILEVGDDSNGHPRIVIKDEGDNEIILHTSCEEAKEAAKHLYQKCSVYFDANVEIWMPNSEQIAQEQLNFCKVLP